MRIDMTQSLTNGSFILLDGTSTSADTSSSSPACDLAKRMAFSLDGCVLRSPAHADVRRCLASRPLLFLGTSVTRYQYLSLVHFLERGEWPSRCTSAHFADGPPPLEFGFPGPMTDERAAHDHEVMRKNPHLRPSVVKEREWALPDQNHWKAFFNGTSHLFNGNEQCDCNSGTSSDRCGRRRERRYYSNEGVELSYVVSDCGMLCTEWVHRCASCWRDGAKLPLEHYSAVLLNQGLQSGWFHPPSCYSHLASAAGAYIRRKDADGNNDAFAGRGFWVTTNWPERAYILGRKQGAAIKGLLENVASMNAIVTNATIGSSRLHHETNHSGHDRPQPLKDKVAAVLAHQHHEPLHAGGWSSFDLGALDRKLRLLEATLLNSTNGDGWCPLRWDPFHYEPFFYEVVNILLLKELCGSSLDVWRCPNSY